VVGRKREGRSAFIMVAVLRYIEGNRGMRGNRNVGELVLVSINFCYCYLLYVVEAVGAGPRILETIYPIGWRGECDE